MAGVSGDDKSPIYELNGHTYTLVGAAFTKCLKCGEDYSLLRHNPCEASAGEAQLVILAQIRDSLAVIVKFIHRLTPPEDTASTESSHGRRSR